MEEKLKALHEYVKADGRVCPMPSTDDFQLELDSIFSFAEEKRLTAIIIKSGDFLRRKKQDFFHSDGSVFYRWRALSFTPSLERKCTMINLSAGKCVACRGSEPTLTDSEISELHPQVAEWQIKEVAGVKRLERVFKLKNFVEAIAFTNKIGVIAEEEDHHPLIITEWGRVTVQWWSHKIKGLHKNDFIMAAKTDEIIKL